MPSTRKMVVVPYNLYQDLIGRQTMDIKEEGPLKLAHQELEKVKRRRPRTGAKLSAKNIQYQQNLRGYLRARKRLVNRPMKVQFGTTGITVPQQQPPEPAVSLPTPPTATPTPRKRTQTISDSSDFEEAFETPPKKSARKKSKGEGIGQAAGDLFTLISYNPKQFGLTSTGHQIINPSTNSPFKKSETIKSIEHILQGAKPGLFTPPGTKSLKGKLLRDPAAKAIIDQARAQSGKGKKKKAGKSKSTFAFRPAKW